MADATAREQLMLELVNRARLDPLGEARRFGIDLNQGLAPGTIQATPKQVLAFNTSLNASSDVHSQWMLDTDIFSHTGAGGSDAGSRMASAGYVFSGSWTWGENIAWSGTTGQINGDATIAGHHQSLFLSAGHRTNILGDGYREIGIGSLTGVFTSKGTNYNALMTTQNFARSGSSVFVTGVTYNDTINDDFYSIGEGIGGRTVEMFQNGAVIASTTSAQAGGYALASAITGNVEIRFTGAGLSATMGAAVKLEGANIKIDLVDGNTIQSSTSATLTQSALHLALLGIADVSGIGNGLANTITGNAGDNVLRGFNGNDLLQGGGGEDVLGGGANNDVLNGGAAKDRMSGGGGRDIFVFDDLAEARSGMDIISDFQQGLDRIDLRGIDAVTGGGDNAFHMLAVNEAFSGSGAASAGELRHYQLAERTIIEGDVNGDGAADFRIQLNGVFTLSGADVLL